VGRSGDSEPWKILGELGEEGSGRGRGRENYEIARGFGLHLFDPEAKRWKIIIGVTGRLT